MLSFGRGYGAGWFRLFFLINTLLFSVHVSLACGSWQLVEVGLETQPLTQETHRYSPNAAPLVNNASLGTSGTLVPTSFQYYAQAWAWRQKLMEELDSVFEVVPASETGSNINASVTLPFGPTAPAIAPGLVISTDDLFEAAGVVKGGSVSESLLNSAPSALSRQELVLVGMHAPTNPKGVPALERYLEVHPDEPEANSVRLRLVRRILARKNTQLQAEALLDAVIEEGSPDEVHLARYLKSYVKLKWEDPAISYNAFMEFARDATAPVSLRRDAMRRAAGAAHVARDYPNAWLAFEQIEGSATDPEEKAEARVQLAGLAFELADSGKGTWEEVREICGRVALVEDAPRRHIATAELIRLETYFKQGNYVQTVNLVDGFLEEYADISREAATAQYWKGIAHFRLQQVQLAKATFEAIMAMDLGAEDLFGGEDPIASSALWRGFIAKGEDDFETVNACGSVILERGNPKVIADAERLLGLTTSSGGIE